MGILDFWAGADIAFTAIFVVSLLIMLYAMSLMSRSIRLLEYKVTTIEKDIQLLSEEF